MTPVYLSQSASPFPFVELKDQHLQHFTLIPPDQQAASSSSCPHHHSFNLTQDHVGKHFSPESHQTQHKVNTNDLEGGSSDHHVMSSSSTSPATDDSGNDDGSVRWMATKVRLQIGKMVNSSTNDHRGKKSTRVIVVQENSEKSISASNDNVRVCSACNTTKTPLWRSGPRGPKSLCNACGIRQRKARRAMAAAEAAATNGTDMGATTTYKVHKKEKKSRTSYVVDTQKMKQENDVIISSTISPDHDDDKGKRINKFEEFAISLSKNSAFRQVFPRDEEEAAILLMALSCGLIHG